MVKVFPVATLARSVFFDVTMPTPILSRGGGGIDRANPDPTADISYRESRKCAIRHSISILKVINGMAVVINTGPREMPLLARISARGNLLLSSFGPAVKGGARRSSSENLIPHYTPSHTERDYFAESFFELWVSFYLFYIGHPNRTKWSAAAQQKLSPW